MVLGSNRPPPEEALSFGAMLYALRKKVAVTQTEVGKASGYSKGYVCSLENSRVVAPPAKAVRKLAAAMHLDETDTLQLEEAAGRERSIQVRFTRGTPTHVLRVAAQLRACASFLAPEDAKKLESFLMEVCH